MAEPEETVIFKADHQEDDRVIPVFTVIKNNAILKNIYLLHSPPEMRGTDELQTIDESGSDDREVVLTVGRHPDCSIVLSHPSISRFHLRICSKPSARELSVTDLSSVHGTWVRGKRIEPKVKVELNEGDELRLGGSSRLYKLHWITVRQAYDMDHPFFPAADVMMGDDMDKQEVETYLGERGLMVENVDNSNGKLVGLEACKEEEVRCQSQRLVKNDSVIRGILKHRASLLPLCDMIEPLGLLLPYEETVASAEFRGLEKGDQCDDAIALAEISSEIETAQRPALEYDELLRLDELDSSLCCTVDKKPTKDHEKLRVLSPFSESCREEPGHLPLRAEAYLQDDRSQDGVQHSQILDDCLDGVGYVKGEGSSTLKRESAIQTTNVKSQVPVSLVNVNITVENKAEECILVNTAKDIERHVTARESPIPAFTLEEFAASAEVGNIGKVFEEVCQLSYLESEVPKPLADKNGTIRTESINEIQQLQLVSKTLKHVPGSEAINQESSNLTSKDQTLQSEMVMLAPVLGTIVTETLVTNSANGDQQSGLDVQILEPLLNSFLFPENGEEYQEKVVLKTEDGFKPSDAECQSAKTPSDEEKTSEGNLNVASGQKLSTTNLCSITRKPVSIHQVSICRNKGKRLESSIGAEKQQHQSGVSNKLISGSLLTDSHNCKDDIEMSTSEEGNFTSNTAVMHSNVRASVLDENKITSATSDRSGLLKGSSSPFPKSTSKTKIADKYLDDEIDTYITNNVTPNFRLLKSTMNIGMLDQNELKSSVSWRSDSSKVVTSSIQMEQDLFASDKENQTPVIFLEKNQARSTFADTTRVDNEMTSARRKGKQIPLQSLLVDSSGKSIMDTSICNDSCRCVSSSSPVQDERMKTSPETEGRVKWYMVVDTASLLNGESRKEMQLLQGLRGTQLIIPRAVLRELESLEQPTWLCGRTAEVSAALKWLRECMAKTEWWIHIQSSSEEENHPASTPPASPRQQHSSLDLGNWSWTSSLVFTSFMNVPSSKADDVLQCALQHTRGMDCEGKVVILSDDIALKIKAIAEGLKCETATEFRRSLINPFSGRFLWAKSSPRGHTWSTSDDVVLKELFYSSHSKKSLKAPESGKGLKLLLPRSYTVQSEQHHRGISSQAGYRYLFPYHKFHAMLEYLKHQMIDNLFS